MSSKTTNLGLTKPAEDEFYDINVQNENMDIIDEKIGELESPAYTEAIQTAKLVSGEKFMVAFGKIAKAVSTLISHISTKATSSVLGHVKLSDSTESTSAASAGVAATPKAVKTAYDLANENSKKIGTTDISGLGDGTLTGAVNAVNQSLASKSVAFGNPVISDSASSKTAEYKINFPSNKLGIVYICIYAKNYGCVFDSVVMWNDLDHPIYAQINDCIFIGSVRIKKDSVVLKTSKKSYNYTNNYFEIKSLMVI